MIPLRAALVIGALLAPASVFAQASHRWEYSVEEISDQVEHPCTGELVQIAGTLTVRTRRTVDANGVVHLASNSVPSIRGEGPSGEYIVREVNHVVDHFVDNELYPENVSFKFDFHLIGKGAAPNFLFTLNGHFITEADGTVKIDFQHEVGKCTGKA